jgi:small subunit ribosomal protein S6
LDVSTLKSFSPSLAGACRMNPRGTTSREEIHAVAINVYETVFIAEPELSNDQADQLINKIKQVITTKSGTVTAEDRWGRRSMAYPVQGHREGFYTVLNYTAEPTVVLALEHLFNVTDSVIRHITVRVIKKNKKFAPRRERSATATDGPRTAGRPPMRPRPETRGAADATPAAAPAAAVTAPATPPTPAVTEGGATA